MPSLSPKILFGLAGFSLIVVIPTLITAGGILKNMINLTNLPRDKIQLANNQRDFGDDFRDCLQTIVKNSENPNKICPVKIQDFQK